MRERERQKLIEKEKFVLKFPSEKSKIGRGGRKRVIGI
jgi:hypothetical protein